MATWEANMTKLDRKIPALESFHSDQRSLKEDLEAAITESEKLLDKFGFLGPFGPFGRLGFLHRFRTWV